MSQLEQSIGEIVSTAPPAGAAPSGNGPRWRRTGEGRRANQHTRIHIDNTATHLGLDDTQQLMGKYARSGGNFALMARRHPEDAATMPLFRMATRLRGVPFRKLFKWFAADVAKSESLPLAVRGPALKTWRAFVYAEAL